MPEEGQGLGAVTRRYQRENMNIGFALMIFLSDSKGKLSSPYKIIETNSSMERFDKPYERKVACT